MKSLILALALLCVPTAWAACSSTSYGNGWTCIQQKGTVSAAASATAVTTMTVTAGHSALLLAQTCYNSSCGGTTGQVDGITLTMSSSSGSDTFVACSGCPSTIATGLFRIGAWVVTSLAADTSFTVTAANCAATCFYTTLYTSEWTGMAAASPFDVVATGNTLSNVTTATITPSNTTNATDLIVGFISLSASAAVTPGAGFTEIGEDSTGTEHEAKSVVATGSNPCSWSWTGATTWDGICVAIKAGAGGGATVRHRAWVINNN